MSVLFFYRFLCYSLYLLTCVTLGNVANNITLYEITTKYPDVIKGQKDRSIYILDQGIRHLVPDWVTYISLGLDKIKARVMGDAEVIKFPLGEPVSEKKNLSLADEHYKKFAYAQEGEDIW